MRALVYELNETQLNEQVGALISYLNETYPNELMRTLFS